MASSTLIGTAPDQVPTNGDLGDLAFQNKEFVEFYDGRGGLGHLDITAISRQLSVSAIDVFIYDTSKDSDGGAWRKRCQHTSWYNEELNTTIRGSRREFPAVAVIVATTNSITIYDGDVPDMPMWMVFTANGASNWYGSGTPVTCVSFLNGIMTVGTGGTGGGVRNASFVADKFVVSYTVSGIGPAGGISNRNSAVNWSGDPYIVIINAIVNDVAMTVLPNAPIDAATGLPIPTIAVATSGGVSVIKDDGSVVDIIGTDQGTDAAIDSISFIGNDKILYSHRYASEVNTIPATDVSSAYYNTTAGWVGRITNSTSHVSTTQVAALSSDGNIESVAISNDDAVSKSISGLSLAKNFAVSNDRDRAAAFITSKYNTGWMPGDIKGAWLSDTTQETVVGSGNISGWSSTGNWTYQPSITLSWTGSAISFTGNGTGSSVYLFLTIPVQQNTDYTVQLSFSAWNAVAPVINTSQYSMSGALGTISSTSAGTYTISFNSGSNSYVYFQTYQISTTATVITALDVRKGDADRSVNNKGLQVFGNITKTPVAAGADLVAYSGWSNSNYLKQPPNPSLDFGSGGYAVMLWAKNTTTGCAIGRGPNDSNESMNVYFDPGTYGIYFDYGDAAQYAYAASIKGLVNDGNWHFVVCHVRAGERGVIWVDGVQAPITGGGAANSTFMNSSSWETYVGIARQPDQPLPFGGSLALVRISATIPSAEQIAKIYNDEKVLFQDNAKATLYGTSDAVTALAYDEDTNLLHVGTSSGRSVFNGLRRVDNTTDAVGACISAADGLVVED